MSAVQLYSRLIIIVLIVSCAYGVPFVLATQPWGGSASLSNINTMTGQNHHSLDVVTINFLHAIEDAGSLYGSQHFSTSEEMAVRVRLREAFEDYFGVLVPLETKQGLDATEHSREVIQDAIADFMELDTQFERLTMIALDLNVYSRVMTESLVHTAVAA